MSKHKVYQVNDLFALLEKSNPQKLNITAYGMVKTSGWSQPELIPYIYVIPPVDGIQDFDFIAEPPAEISLQVLTPIVAHYSMEDLPSWVRGVRVHTSSNTKEVLLNEASDKNYKICVKGTLTNEGVECQALRAESGELYTLVGDLQGFEVGDQVYVLGTIAPINCCMQGITIAIDWINKNPPKCSCQ